jgi:hypothetical protein
MRINSILTDLEKSELRQLSPEQLRRLYEQLKPDELNEVVDVLLEDEPVVRKNPVLGTSRIIGLGKLEKSRQRQLNYVRASQEIGQLPDVQDIERRTAASTSIIAYARAYHTSSIFTDLAQYHFTLVERCELVLREGGTFAVAVPRGGGKTTWCEIAVEWALLNGHKRWPMLINATEELSLRSFNSIKQSLKLNRVLAGDYPESIYPVQKLEGSARRAEGQRCAGERTEIYFGADRLILPTIAEHEYSRWVTRNFDDRGFPRPKRTSGNRLTVTSLTGGIRGKVETTADLEKIRPDFVLADDPQTRESAKSFTQSEYRLQILKGDVEYLAGGLNCMSLLVPCTVIYRDDMADQLLNRAINPEFRGEKYKMLVSFPENMEFWNKYRDMRRDLLLSDHSLDPLNDFYLENREIADAGAEITWSGLFNGREVSGIQHAMNLWLKDPEAFAAEAQNEPLSNNASDDILTPVSFMVEKQSHCDQTKVPLYCDKIAAHIDVQGPILFYSVVAASIDFESSVLDLGSWPNQGRIYFSTKDKLKTFEHIFPAESELVRMYLAIKELIQELSLRRFYREDGLEMQISKILVDCNYQGPTVIKACTETPFRHLVTPATGFAVSATDTPFALRPRKSGEIKGHEWIQKPKPDTPSVIYVQVNVNAWKETLHRFFRTTAGPGSLAFWKDHPNRFRMAAEHCNAEIANWVAVKERKVAEFKERPSRPDNHFFDTLVGALVGLSMLGCAVPGAQDRILQERRRIPKKINSETLRGLV